MPRTTILLALLALFGLSACVSSEPKVSTEEQVPAEARQAMESTATPAEGGGGEGGGGGGGEPATFVAVDIDWAEAPESVPAGDLSVELVNDGAALHNLVFEGVNDEEPIVEAPGGETVTGDVALEAGEYTFWCSVPGHREAGMEGTLRAEG